MTKIILYRPKKEAPSTETYVALLGEGHYAITQAELFNDKMRHTIYLTRQDLKNILKEKEVDLSKFRQATIEES